MEYLLHGIPICKKKTIKLFKTTIFQKNTVGTLKLWRKDDIEYIICIPDVAKK